jgi:hypothetical protein
MGLICEKARKTYMLYLSYSGRITHGFSFSGPVIPLPEVLLADKRQVHFSLLLPTTDSMVVTVSSLILSSKLSGNHIATLLEIPGSRKKRYFRFLFVKHLSFSDMSCLLVIVWLSWLISCVRELDISNCRMIRSRDW